MKTKLKNIAQIYKWIPELDKFNHLVKGNTSKELQVHMCTFCSQVHSQEEGQRN